MIYTEGILWYFLLLDLVAYLIFAFAPSAWHQQTSHWISAYIPVNKVIAGGYLLLVLWLGFTLYRMQLIIFW